MMILAMHIIGNRTTDIIDLVAAHMAADERPQNGIRIAWHRPCSQQHAMKTGEELNMDVLEWPPVDDDSIARAILKGAVIPKLTRRKIKQGPHWEEFRRSEWAQWRADSRAPQGHQSRHP